MMRFLLLCTFLIAPVAALAPAFAQEAQPSEAAAGAGAGASASAGAEAGAEPVAGPAPEEFLALNFYMQQNDVQAVEAELRRLQLKYPGWQPPTDLSRLSQTTPSVEIDTIYRLISAARYPEARSAIEETRARFPNWQPPSEMISLLETAEGQAGFDAALAAGDLRGALAVVSGAPGLLRCDRINNAWRIAEAWAASGNRADAFGTYRAVAGACVTPSELIATLEKADAVAEEAEILALIDEVGLRLPAMAPDLEALRVRLMAGRGQFVVTDAPEDISAEPGAEAAARAAVNPGAKAEAAPAAAATVTASTAARTAAASGAAAGTAPAAPAAPRAAAPAAGGGSSGGGSALQAAFTSGDWARCMALSAGATATGAIYQRGWCAYNLNQPMEALNSFKRATSGRLPGDQRRDAYYGMSLAYLKMGMAEEASQLAAQVDFTRKQRLDIERQILDQRGVSAYKRKDYRAAISYFNALEQLNGGIRRDLAVLRAYALLNVGKRDAARKEFLRLNNELSTQETKRGLQATSGG